MIFPLTPSEIIETEEYHKIIDVFPYGPSLVFDGDNYDCMQEAILVEWLIHNEFIPDPTVFTESGLTKSVFWPSMEWSRGWLLEDKTR